MSSIMRWRSGLMGLSLIGSPVSRLECLDPSILKTEHPARHLGLLPHHGPCRIGLRRVREVNHIATINIYLRIGKIAPTAGDQAGNVVDVHVRDDHGIDRRRADADRVQRPGKTPGCLADRSCRPSVDEGFDVAVRIAHLPDSSLVSTQVGEVRHMLVASQDYLARRGTPREPRDLKTHAVIGHTTLVLSREWRHIDGGRPARLALRSRIETNDAHTNIALAEQGKGITVVLSYMVGDALRSGRLVPVLQGYAPPPVPVHLIYAQRRIIAPKVRAFIDFAAPRLRPALAEPARRKGAKQVAAGGPR
jgi:hypothetical protein